MRRMRLPHSRVFLAGLLFTAVCVSCLAQEHASQQAAKGQLVASPASLSFGNVQVGSSSSQTETLTNTGSANLTIYQDSITGSGFSLSGLIVPLTLTPGQSYTFSVTFTPASSGSVTGIASVGSRMWRSKLSLPLTGAGAAAGQLAVSPAMESFGNVNVGSSASMSAAFTASGSAVTISSAGDSNGEFTLSGIAFPLTVQPGQSVPFTVTFAPQTSGTASGTLSFVNNSPASPVVQSLNGSGVSPQHSVSLNWTASTSAVVGYNVYRGNASGGPYAKVNAAVDPSTSYVDVTVSSGLTYYYVATAVDSSGSESAYSNEIQAVIPTP